jgi:holliday junction DNA helicase RuvA
MIGSLRGTLAGRLPGGEVLVEVGGVGYRVVTGVRPVTATVGEEVFLHVHTHVREDAMVLYGFVDGGERATFEALIGSHGVGPALALSILSVHRPDDLARIVATDDVEALTLVPGVGAKTAARLLLELKTRFDAMEGPGVGGHPAAAEAGALAEVRAALDGLGYAADEVRTALRDLPADGATDQLLRAALRELSVAGR